MQTEMTAGPELDAMVAEKVMNDDPFITPSFSTDISAAWKVVETLSDRFWCQVRSPFVIGDKYCAGFTMLGATGWNGRPDYQALAETAPLAICLAALRAVEGRES